MRTNASQRLRSFVVLTAMGALVSNCGEDQPEKEPVTDAADFVEQWDALDASMKVDVPVLPVEVEEEAEAIVVDPCEPNPCNSPPPAECAPDGVTVIEYVSPGICTNENGEAKCSYGTTKKDCSADGMQCVEGKCVGVDKCNPNPCTNPPAAHCGEDGATLVTYPGVGECTQTDDDFECFYAPQEQPCGEGLLCKSGACIDPCDPNPCNEPPPPECHEDGVTLVTYPEMGECKVEGGTQTCEYAPQLQDCSAGGSGYVCTDGACVPKGWGNNPDEPGEVIFTEFMAKSQPGTGDKGEWVELYNAGGEPFDLGGCFLSDLKSDSHLIADHLVFSPGEFLVLARSLDPSLNHGLEADYEFKGFALANSSDELILTCGGTVIDEVIYSGIVVQGVAAQLDPEKFDSESNGDMTNWCLAVDPYGTAEPPKLGTPGAPNVPCPPPDPCTPNPCVTPPDPECLPGEVAVTYEPEGVCTNEAGVAKCEYIAIKEECAEKGMKCVAGECQPDPCNPNPCNEPEPPTCQDDKTVLFYETPGICSDVDGVAVCEYIPQTLDCSASGKVCVAGECVFPWEGNMPKAPGEVIVTEFMARSQAGPGDKGEWFELYNTTQETFDLGSCVVKDSGTDSYTIIGPLGIAPGQYLVLSNSGAPEENHGLPTDHVYTGITLGNNGDEIILSCGDIVIDEITYVGAQVVLGAATQLDPEALDGVLNDDQSNWCTATAEYGTAGKLGSPGGANSPCPPPDPCTPNPCTSPPQATCKDDTILLTYPSPGKCTNNEGQAVCEYEEVLIDCSLDGKVCKNGECVPPDLDPRPSAEGEVLITEFMAKSQAGADPGEWFELHNPTSKDFNLMGCILKGKGNESHTLSESLKLPAGGYVVLAASGDPAKNHGLTPDYVYSSFPLSNNGDTIALECDSILIDSVTYSAEWVALEAATQLDPSAFDAAKNDKLENWCTATAGYGTAEKKGTPGLANTPCPKPLEVGWCRLQWPPEINSAPGVQHTVYGRVLVEGVTTKTNGTDPDPLVKGEVGYGPDGTDPDGNKEWTWISAEPNPGWDALAANEPDNDEYQAVLITPGPGVYDFAYRFSADEGKSWKYCDLAAGFGHDGSEDGYQIEHAGAMTITE